MSSKKPFKPYTPKAGLKKYKPKEKNTVNNRQDKEIVKLTKAVRQLQTEPEVKIHEFIEFGNPVATETIYTYPLMETGSKAYERIGNEIISKRLEVSLRFAMIDPPTVPYRPYNIRVIHFWDKQMDGNLLDSFRVTTGSSPTTAELAVSLLDNRQGQSSPIIPYNEEAEDRFVILSDKVHVMRNNYAEELPIMYVKAKINLHNAKINYADSSNNLESLTRRGLRTVVLIEGNGNLAMQAFWRFYFIDV